LFPRLQHFYESTSLGAVRLSDVTGLSQGVIVALVTVFAIGSFVIAEKVERRGA
jgi:hypothetical protein